MKIFGAGIKVAILAFWPIASAHNISVVDESSIVCGAERLDQYLSFLQGRRVGLIVNPTSRCGNRHLVDTLRSLGVKITKIFGPEHGYRGDQPAGAPVASYKDPATGITVVSLYGVKKKPTVKDLEDVDVLVFDIQDVGARFYTYISTMSLCMEAAAEQGKKFLVLDRPNPNGYYVDGPVLESACSSFVGMHPVPIVHGMTVGEYALMINGEKWLRDGLVCDLTVIPCLQYTHKSRYRLPIPPSPNLNTEESVYLYPTLGLFEGTVMSVGRGTERPFTVVGHPRWAEAPVKFIPRPIAGMSDQPKYSGQECRGYDLSAYALHFLKEQGRIELFWIIEAYRKIGGDFFTPYFDKLAGTPKLREQIQAAVPEAEIRRSWQEDLIKFKSIRKKYLLYPDFE
ncbi:MAG: DUF1343 domain-containing protein [Flavobacteriales bacterium]|nr:DUF1343 domain-containing protein [Flavobacteriales bacterium]MDW8409529.1 DUF1343 domain-containing protein [Flavobacteriales bacterium]